MTVCVHNATERNEEWEDACEGCEVHARIWLSSSSSFSGVVGGCGEGQNSGYNSNDEKHWAMCQTATVEEDGNAVDWSGECSCCSFYWVEGDTDIQVEPHRRYRGAGPSTLVAHAPRPATPRHATSRSLDSRPGAIAAAAGRAARPGRGMGGATRHDGRVQHLGSPQGIPR